jgi:outer membrane protein OmpA-like peptidoglycan-associated protein
MKARDRLVQLLPCLLFACCIIPSTARADCKALLNQLDLAISSRQLSEVSNLDAKVANDGSCGEPEVRGAHRAKATLQFDLVKSLMKDGAPQSQYENLLLEASNTLWDAAAELGNIESSQRQFAEATIAYERSIELVKNLSLTPVAPDKRIIAGIVSSAQESRILAANEEAGHPTYVAAAKDHRDGTVGGAMSESIRGFTATAIPIPINFETASAKFTEIGQKAANDFLLALQQQRPVQITLVGHTDERGEADYNLRLSDERAKAVASFLRQNGITAKIDTIAKGKTEPLQLTNSSQYSREDIWALNRRVEWKRE